MRMTGTTSNKVTVSLDQGNDRLEATSVVAATDIIFEVVRDWTRCWKPTYSRPYFGTTKSLREFSKNLFIGKIEIRSCGRARDR